MRTARVSAACAGAVALLVSAPALAQDLNGSGFQVRAGASGITSLRRADDTYDTEYIAPGRALGRLVVRYRTTRNGDWRELSGLIQRPSAGGSLTYALGAPAAPLATRASASAVSGAGGLRALNDGVVPIGAAAATAAVFAWPAQAGATRWVQYTFPAEQQVARTEIFWTAPPQSWRLLYLEGREWKPVQPSGAYGRAAGAFTSVDFTPVTTLALRLEAVMPPEGTVSLAEWRVGPPPLVVAPADLDVTETFGIVGDALSWTIALTNRAGRPIEIGDLALPLPFAERVPPRADIYTRKLLRHALVAGHGSWVYWERSNAEGPFLVLTPEDAAKFEYFDSAESTFTPFVHAKAASATARAAGGSWRLPVSALRLERRGDAVSYRFTFRWARDAAGVREILYANGKFDTRVVPGMVVPSDLEARVALRTRNRIIAIVAAHPADTAIDTTRSASGIYAIRFSRLGENMLTVKYGGGRWTTLEFFVTEPLDTVIRKRAAFLVSHQQHSDPSKWYYGAFGDWDQKNEALRNPEDRDGLSTWLTDADDDAGNARPAFVASKNVYFPEQTEIDGLERYIQHYLWGGMQMTDRERYPYAIYGIPNWKANRESPDAGRNGQAHVWRIYDYPHIVLLYYRMYQIAKFYPSRVKYLGASGYLERAYRTAVAYWTVPLEVERWSADAVGTMNEAIIPEVIDALESEGRTEWARTLRGYWEGKVDRFVNRTPNLYGSEFAFDSTGFESTGAFARYALQHPIASVSREAAQAFMDRQLRLNMADRGWLETTYYQLGSDYRGNLTYLLSYMSQMGGWSILDYALHFASDPAEYLRLGYASLLSSWALVNSGNVAGETGYWYPSANNDGAAGGGFMPEALGRTWIGKTIPRGAWYYSAEEDVGYCAALRTHTTIVTRDPVFGEIAYGGVLTRDRDVISVIPRDGLRARLDVVRDGQRLHVELDHDGFARGGRIAVKDDLSRIAFTLENRTGGAHTTELTLAGLPDGKFTVTVAGTAVTVNSAGGRHVTVVLKVPAAVSTPVTIERRR
jgi:hypothetical protein